MSGHSAAGAARQSHRRPIGNWHQNALAYTNNQNSETSKELIPMTREQFENWAISISNAANAGEPTVMVPSTTETVSVDDARAAAKAIRTPLDGPEPPPTSRREEQEAPPKQKAPTLIIRGNIDALEHPESIDMVHADGPNTTERPSALKSDVVLRTHQIAGIGRMQQLFSASPDKCRGLLMADEMGLGKTIQLLALIAWAVEKHENLPPALVVAPVSLLDNWREEIERFFKPDKLRVLTAYGDSLSSLRVARENIDEQLQSDGLVRFLKPGWRGNAHIVLTTYETLCDLQFSFALETWSILVCDEAQKIKNPSAMVTRAVKKQNVRFRIACTGTPVENSLLACRMRLPK
jgi:SNF2 family DNA or RNA helicase